MSYSHTSLTSVSLIAFEANAGTGVPVAHASVRTFHLGPSVILGKSFSNPCIVRGTFYYKNNGSPSTGDKVARK